MVLASGSGSNLQALIDATISGKLDANITGFIASKPGIGAISRAEKAGIPSCVINRTSFETENEFANSLLTAFRDLRADYIILAGYLIKIPVNVIQKWESRIINIHPSLLPDYGGKGFYGLNVHRAVIRDKQKLSGCTVHIVNEEFDKGPILAQSTVSVLENDTPESLAARVLEQEHILLPQTIQQLIKKTFP